MSTQISDAAHEPASKLLHDPDALATEREAADFLGVTARALQKWRTTGNGPLFVHISSRCVRYRRRDLLAWSEAHLKSSTSE